MTEPQTRPSSGWDQDMEWATRRAEDLAMCFRVNAGRFGAKLLKGHGYPNEVMREAQDALALETLLAAHAADTSQIAELHDHIKTVVDRCAELAGEKDQQINALSAQVESLFQENQSLRTQITEKEYRNGQNRIDLES